MELCLKQGPAFLSHDYPKYLLGSVFIFMRQKGMGVWVGVELVRTNFYTEVKWKCLVSLGTQLNHVMFG